MSTPLLVSLAYFKAHIKADTSDGDTDLEFKLRAASRAVLLYITNGADEFTDSAGDVYLDTSGEPIGVPEDVQLAVIFLAAAFDRNRNSNEEGLFENGYLPPFCTSLLAHYRDPSLA